MSFPAWWPSPRWLSVGNAVSLERYGHYREWPTLKHNIAAMAFERDDGVSLLVSWRPWGEALAECRRLRAGLPADLRVALLDRLKKCPPSFVEREDEVIALRTLRRRIVVHPRRWYRELLAALRAGDVDAVARFAHGGSFQG